MSETISVVVGDNYYRIYAFFDKIILIRNKDSNQEAKSGHSSLVTKAESIDDDRKKILLEMFIEEQASAEDYFSIPMTQLIQLKLEKKNFGNLEMTAKWVDDEGKKKEIKGYLGSKNGFLTKDRDEKFRASATAIQDLLEGLIPEDKLEIVDR
jgi:hypothetical protein